MELRLHHIIHLYNVFRENGGKENCAQLIEEEFNRMFGINDEHDCNVVSMNSLNIHDANDMQSHKLGDAMFDEDDIFCPSSFDEGIYYDETIVDIEIRKIHTDLNVADPLTKLLSQAKHDHTLVLFGC